MSKQFLLFDNDGVLVETEQWYYEANVKALGEIDVELTFDVYMEIMARGGTAWEVAKAQGVSQKIIDKQRETRDIYYREFLQSEDIEIDGVVDTLKELKQNYKMGIITTARRVDFDLIHNHRKIIKQMEFSLCVEEYPRAKPYPDPYLAGMKKFGATKEQCLVIEDSQRGLTSAYNADIECVVVENKFTMTHDFSKATYRISKITNLPNLLKEMREKR